MNFDEELRIKIQKAEETIQRFLPKEEGYQKTVISAMNYSMLSGGKRLRPLFMYETYKMFGGSTDIIEPFMAAIEMIHTYSLVHDDLPAMDNDEYRRGRKTTHIVYGEGMAVLAGDALLNYAFETALMSFEMEPQNPNIGRALKILAGKAGIYGMIGGQTADVEAENRQDEITLSQLLYIHENKTGALIQSAMMIGAVLAGACEAELKTIEEAALCIGTAFQIQDDILDVSGDEAILGKPVGSDSRNSKTTYVTLKGMEQSAQDVKNISERARQLMEELPYRNDFLLQLVESLITREK